MRTFLVKESHAWQGGAKGLGGFKTVFETLVVKVNVFLQPSAQVTCRSHLLKTHTHTQTHRHTHTPVCTNIHTACVCTCYAHTNSAGNMLMDASMQKHTHTQTHTHTPITHTYVCTRTHTACCQTPEGPVAATFTPKRPVPE